MSFAKEFTRNVRAIEEEIAYYRTFARLDGMAEPIAVLEEMHDKWQQRNLRYEGRGRAITEPFDWQDDREARDAAKEIMNKLIKAAKAAEAAAHARSQKASSAAGNSGEQA